jgi:pimeloyl-ACP methyl ester carboxylesterase
MASPTVSREEMVLHGHRVSYRVGGSGPVVLLIHGITSSSANWEPVLPALAREFTVLAPDLMGHGESAKPQGDYSLGAYASGLRDLVLALDFDPVTVVGHSLGGGVAMQFAYQFPERTERMVLVSSGGLGREVHMLLRSAALPGAELVLPLIASRPLLGAGAAVGRFAETLGLQVGADIAEMARGVASLAEMGARQAFLQTVRAVIDPGGQRVSATDRLYLAEGGPSMIIWGERDPIIPVRHGIQAHELMTGSRLEIFPDAGHFPHHDDPLRFADVLTEFVTETPPADFDEEQIRDLVLSRQ